MTKFYAQEKRVFDINKVTVVGSPTITSDGVASGFSKGGHLTAPFILSEYTTFEIKITLDLPIEPPLYSASIPFTMAIDGRNFIQLMFTKANLGTRFVVISDYTNLDSSTVTNSWQYGEKSVEYSLGYDGTFYYFKKNGFLLNQFTVDYKVPTDNFTLYFGTAVNNFDWFYNTGSIDLNSFKIYVDNELVYSPTKPTYYLERRKEGFDLSKFTVVGSPTITEDGVVSGFSASNYLLSNKVFDFSNQEVDINFKLGDIINLQLTLGILSFINNIFSSTIEVLYNWGKFSIRITDGTTRLETTPVEIYSLNQANINIYLKNKILGYKITRKDNVKFSKEIDISSLDLTKLKDMQLQFGRWNNNWNSVGISNYDLKQFSITVDGKEVFTGAKEKFYAMRGM